MLGIQDPWVVCVYILCIASAALCVIWGIARWNFESPVLDEPEEEVRQWAAEEEKVEDEL